MTDAGNAFVQGVLQLSGVKSAGSALSPIAEIRLAAKTHAPALLGTSPALQALPII